MLLDFDYENRNVMYQCINDRFARKAPIDYLEFGVAGGVSMKHWLDINPNPESRFYGFDSFEGLPEDWTASSPKGSFSQEGIVPDLQDKRVRFIKGLFQETVEPFLRIFKPRNKLVVHMDADLYSSTLYCLMHLNRHLLPGSIILFDEFNSRNCSDECAALADYCKACHRDFKMLARREDNMKVAVEML